MPDWLLFVLGVLVAAVPSLAIVATFYLVIHLLTPGEWDRESRALKWNKKQERRRKRLEREWRRSHPPEKRVSFWDVPVL